MDLELLKELVATPGVSGSEDEIIKAVSSEFKKYSDEVEIDKMGNVIATKRGVDERAPRIMVPVHLDEVGLVVKYIEETGFLRVEKVGDLLDYIFPGLRVKVHGTKGSLPGVVGVIPAHLSGTGWGGPERQTSPPVVDQFIDVGASSRDEAEELGIEIGSSITYDSDLVVLGKGSLVAGKAFDDRALVAILIETLKRLREVEHEATIYGVGTIEHEPGLRGVRVVAHRLKPDIAIGMDVVIAGDVPNMMFRRSPIAVGRGPSIKVMDVDLPGTGQFSHPKIRELLIKTAREEGIPYQLDVYGSGLTTDASAIQWLGGGIPAGVISLPARYTHGPNEVVSVEDMENMVRLLFSTLIHITSKLSLGRI